MPLLHWINYSYLRGLERNYEEKIHNLEAEIAAKDTLITELNQRLTKLEDRTEVGTQVQEENGDSLAVSNKDNSPRMLFNYLSGRNLNIKIKKEA